MLVKRILLSRLPQRSRSTIEEKKTPSNIFSQHEIYFCRQNLREMLFNAGEVNSAKKNKRSKKKKNDRIRHSFPAA